MKIAVVFVGEVHDQGFNAVALEGALRARSLPGAEIMIVQGVPYEAAAMREAVTGAAARSDGVVFIGGQGNCVVPAVAAEHPDCAFAVVQGEATGPNLASYDVLQEESAFLAGVLAARMTRTGVVGHLSGHRVTPGLKGRAAYVSGVRHADRGVRVLTAFCGTQDDSAIARAWTEAEAEAGADVVFTMLNGARQGAIDACRARGIRQIGNAADWVAADPGVFVASAVAAIDRGVERAIRDLLAGVRPAQVVPMGLGAGRVVSLSMAPDVPAPVVAEIAGVAAEMTAGRLHPALDYAGPEFLGPAYAGS